MNPRDGELRYYRGLGSDSSPFHTFQHHNRWGSLISSPKREVFNGIL